MANYVNQQSYQPFVKPYIAGPTKEYEEQQKRLIADYDDAALQYDALQEAADNMKYIKGSKGDEEAYNQIWSKAKKDIEEAAISGDYENRGRLVRKAIKDFGGKYKPLYDRYQGYNENVKKILDSKEIGEETKKYSLASLQENYLNKPTYNPDGSVELPSWREYMPYKDIAYYDKVVDVLDKVKADKWESLPNAKNIEGYEALISSTTSKRDPDKLYRFAEAYLRNDPEIKNYFDRERHLNKYKYTPEQLEELKQTEDFGKYASRYGIAPSSPEEEAQINNALLQNYIIDKRKLDTAKTAAEALGYTETSYDWKWSPQTEIDLEYKKQMAKNKADTDYANSLIISTPGESTFSSYNLKDQLASADNYGKVAGDNLASAGATARRMGIDFKTINTLNGIIDQKQLAGKDAEDVTGIYRQAMNTWNKNHPNNPITLTEEQLASLPVINNDRQQGLLNLNRQQAIKANLAEIDNGVIKGNYFNLDGSFNDFQGKVTSRQRDKFKQGFKGEFPVKIETKEDYLNYIKESDNKLKNLSNTQGERFYHTAEAKLKALGIKAEPGGGFSKAAYKFLEDMDAYNKGTEKFLKENKEFTSLGYVLQGDEKTSVGKYSKLLAETIDHAPEKLHTGGVDALNVIAAREGVKAEDITGLTRTSKPELYGDSPTPSTSVRFKYKVNGKEKEGTYVFDVPESQLEGHRATLKETYKTGNNTVKSIIARGEARYNLQDNAELTEFITSGKPGKYESVNSQATWTITRTSDGITRMQSDNYSKNGRIGVSIDLGRNPNPDKVLEYIGKYLLEAE
jgi:hypothetical protein